MPRIRKSACPMVMFQRISSDYYPRDFKARYNPPAGEDKTQSLRTPQKDQETGSKRQGGREACVALGVSFRYSLTVTPSRAKEIEKGSGHSEQLSV